MFRRRFIAAGAAFGVAALLAGCSGHPDFPSAGDPSSGGSYSVGVAVYAQAEIIDEIVNAFTATVQDEVGDDVTVTFDIKNANGDPSLVASITREFASSDHDAFAALGTPLVIALATQVTNRPIFALAMGDPVGAEVAESLERPGKNVTGSIDFVDPALLLDDLLALHPGFETIGTVYDPSNQSMQVWTEALRAAAASAGITVEESMIASTADVAQAARSLEGRADVVLVGPDSMVAAGIDALGASAVAAGLPLYTVGGDVTIPGMVGTLGPDYPQLGVSAGVNAAKVLLGADVASTPFTTPGEVTIVVNMARAQELGITIPAALADRIVES
jgi:putative ABC transport system substrate-binding protein